MTLTFRSNDLFKYTTNMLTLYRKVFRSSKAAVKYTATIRKSALVVQSDIWKEVNTKFADNLKISCTTGSALCQQVSFESNITALTSKTNLGLKYVNDTYKKIIKATRNKAYVASAKRILNQAKATSTIMNKLFGSLPKSGYTC